MCRSAIRGIKRAAEGGATGAVPGSAKASKPAQVRGVSSCGVADVVPVIKAFKRAADFVSSPWIIATSSFAVALLCAMRRRKDSDMVFGSGVGGVPWFMTGCWTWGPVSFRELVCSGELAVGGLVYLHMVGVQRLSFMGCCGSDSSLLSRASSAISHRPFTSKIVM